MKIDRTNYELFFIDYFDGNLSDADITLLYEFLEQNADLKIDFSKYEEINISDNSVVSFNVKNELKHIDKNSKFSADIFDAFAVGFIENELTENQRNEFITEVEKNENFKSELNFYKSTKIEADNSIVFENKKSLKHTTLNIYNKPIQYSIAVAASLLLFYSLFQINYKNEKIQAYVPREKSEIFVAENNIENEIKSNEKIIEKSDIQTVVLNKSIKNKIIKTDFVKEPISQIQTNDIISENIEPIFEKIEVAENSKIEIQENIESVLDNKSEIKKRETKGITLKQFAVNFIKTKILKIDDDKSENISLWNLAEVGVNQINKVSNSEVQLNKEINEKGKVKSFSLVAGNFGIEKK